MHSLLTLVAHNGLKIYKMDVKIAFLNGDLKANVFMPHPKGFVVKAKEQQVCKHMKSLYGMKPTP